MKLEELFFNNLGMYNNVHIKVHYSELQGKPKRESETRKKKELCYQKEFSAQMFDESSPDLDNLTPECSLIWKEYGIYDCFRHICSSNKPYSHKQFNIKFQKISNITLYHWCVRCKIKRIYCKRASTKAKNFGFLYI